MLIKLILFLLVVLVVAFIPIIVKYNKEASRQRRDEPPQENEDENIK